MSMVGAQSQFLLIYLKPDRLTGLKVLDRGGRKGVRDNLAFPRVFCAIPRVEKTATGERDKRIIKVRLETTVAVSVNDGKRGWVRNGNLIGSDPNKCACAHQNKHESVQAACRQGPGGG